MIVLSVEPTDPTLRVTSDGGPSVPVVRAPGFLTRFALDSLLRDAGAGRFPGHHAELSVPWLCAELGVAPDVFAKGLQALVRPGLVDDSGSWVMAPVEWDEDWIPLAS